MPDSKGSDLPEKSAFGPNDYIIVVDNSTDPPTSKKMPVQAFVTAVAPQIVEYILTLT